MNELSLFTGIGGGLLGTSCLLGWRCVGAVENNEYCCKTLEQRIKDGVYPSFPIWQMDIREFNRRIACLYRGAVDCITAGFPCQPFSLAGKRRGDQDERNMWPATIECIRLVRPRYLLLENVPGLLTHEYVRRIYGDLAESGYTVPWDCVSAAFCGANHLRRRLWFVADYDSPLQIQPSDEIQAGGNTSDARRADLADTASQRCRETRADSERCAQRVACGGEISNTGFVSEGRSSESRQTQGRWSQCQSARCSSHLSDSDNGRFNEGSERLRRQEGSNPDRRNAESDVADASKADDGIGDTEKSQRQIQQPGERNGSTDVSDNDRERQSDVQGEYTATGTSGIRKFDTASWWDVEPDVGRMVDECPRRVQRLKALGNAQVPLCVVAVWKILSRQFGGC